MDFGLLSENDKEECVVLNDVSMADIRLAWLVYLLAYLSTYCVPITTLLGPLPNNKNNPMKKPSNYLTNYTYCLTNQLPI